MSPSGMRVDDGRGRAAATRGLVEAHGDARGDVAVGCARPCARRACRRARRGKSQRRSRAWPLARPARPVSPSFAASAGRDDAAGAEAVLQPGVLVVDVAAARGSRARARALARAAPRRAGVDVARDAAGHHEVHRAAGGRTRRVGAQHVLLQPRELREAEGEAAVVAEVAEVAQVVGDPLALQRQRAQPRGARRRRRRRRSPPAPARRPTHRRRCCRRKRGRRAGGPRRASSPRSASRCPCGRSRAAPRAAAPSRRRSGSGNAPAR